jgi:hypothetical protein
VGALTMKLRQRLQQYLAGDVKGFMQLHAGEAQRLAEGAFGEAMLHTIGCAVAASVALKLPLLPQRGSAVHLLNGSQHRRRDVIVCLHTAPQRPPARVHRHYANCLPVTVKYRCSLWGGHSAAARLPFQYAMRRAGLVTPGTCAGMCTNMKGDDCWPEALCSASLAPGSGYVAGAMP